MTKSVKIALGVLLAGALVAGIGTGVAFVEYSSLRYEPLAAADAAATITESEAVELPQTGLVHINAPYQASCKVVEDEGISSGTLLVTARASSSANGIVIEGPYEWYVGPSPDDLAESGMSGAPGSANPATSGSIGSAVGPAEDAGASADANPGSGSGAAAGAAAQAAATESAISIYPAIYGGAHQLLVYKDSLLKGLKEGVVYEVPSPYDGFSVEVRVNPADADRIVVD